MGTISNRFDLIRLVLASLVFAYHAIVLSSASVDVLEPVLAVFAELAIQGFFIVSGALVYGSYERSRDLSDYAGKRFRRLYPAYAVIILVPTLIASVLALGAPQRFAQIAEYLGANLLFLNFVEPNLPGLFEGNRFTEVNGSLWTLKIEVMFYLALPLLAWGLARLGGYWWIGIGALVLGGFVWRESLLVSDIPYAEQFARQLPGQMMYFGAGMALWKLWEQIKTHAPVLCVVGAISLLVSLTVPALDSLRVLGLAGLISGIAFAPGPKLNVAALGDVSYGVYIVHFPIVQTLVAFGAFNAFGTIGGLILSTALVYAASYALWWWVEKPALRADSHYRKVAEKGGAPVRPADPSPSKVQASPRPD